MTRTMRVWMYRPLMTTSHISPTNSRAKGSTTEATTTGCVRTKTSSDRVIATAIPIPIHTTVRRRHMESSRHLLALQQHKLGLKALQGRHVAQIKRATHKAEQIAQVEGQLTVFEIK